MSLVQQKIPITIIAMCILLYCTTTAFTLLDKEEISWKHANGQLAYIGKFYDSCNCTISQSFYDNGQLQSISRTNAQGKLDGKLITYFRNGTIRSSRVYAAGLITGRSFLVYPNEKLAREYFYDNGKRIGLWSDYDSLGNLERQIEYKKSYTSGYSQDYNGIIRWYKTGAFFLEQEVSKGTITKQTFANKNISNQNLTYRYLSGKFLYKNNCTSCHGLYKDKTGPKLAGLLARRDTIWVKKFIKNSASLIASGDSLANQVYNEWNKVAMSSFAYLSDEEMESLLYYIGQL